MRPTKIVVIGAGSAAFGPGMAADVLITPDVRGSTLCLVDIDAEGLNLVKGLAERMNSEWGCGVTIEATTDRRKALPEADFVIVAIENERLKRWRMDWEIPLRHGLRQPVAENGGPGGFAHAARNIPVVLGICEDMRKLCPDAWLFNFSNPVMRLTLAAHRYGGVKAVGFCHGIGIAFQNISSLLSIPARELDIKAAGLNHFTWVIDIRQKDTGEDLYPVLRDQLNSWPESFLPLTRDMFELTGLFPVTSDHHISEYLPWVFDARTKPWEKYNLMPADWDQREVGYQRWTQRVRKMASGKTAIDHLRCGSSERPAQTMAAIVSNSNSYELALNLPNEGYIANLPDSCVVEVPAMVSGLGIRGLPMGSLPEPIAELCRRQVAVADLVVEAAATGNKHTALLALMMDPMVTDIEQARGILADYLQEHGDLLPQFA